MERPILYSSLSLSGPPYSLFMPRSTPAASALAPPMPASEGMPFCMYMSAPRPVFSKKALAAIMAVFRGGTASLNVTLTPSDRSIWTASYTSTAHITPRS